MLTHPPTPSHHSPDHRLTHGHRMLGWTAVLFAIQQWLSESPAQKAAASSPAYLSVGMAALSLGVVGSLADRLQALTSTDTSARVTCLSFCHLLPVGALLPQALAHPPLQGHSLETPSCSPSTVPNTSPEHRFIMHAYVFHIASLHVLRSCEMANMMP